MHKYAMNVRTDAENLHYKLQAAVLQRAAYLWQPIVRRALLRSR